MILEKYESTGNDILLAAISELQEEGIEISSVNLSEIARTACDRHFGIGADHLILLDDQGISREDFPGYSQDENAHCRMIFFNSDGSKAEMSGNGIRCFALFAKSKGYGEILNNGEWQVRVETLAGTKSIDLKSNEYSSIQGDVNMGQVLFEPDQIPLNNESSTDVPGTILGKQRLGMAANSGIPHWTLLLEDIEELNSENLASEALSLRFDERFPNQTNVDVVVVNTRNDVSARFFERGANETLSCGTGVTAVAAMLNRAGMCGEDVTVHIRGGELRAVKNKDDSWILSGPVRKIARCEFFSSVG